MEPGYIARQKVSLGLLCKFSAVHASATAAELRIPAKKGPAKSGETVSGFFAISPFCFLSEILSISIPFSLSRHLSRFLPSLNHTEKSPEKNRRKEQEENTNSCSAHSLNPRAQIAL